ncbi:hypothetical protein Poli38472_007599 [Pythium oligandrum]|uniref:Acid phosphatase n=1 Tax=Pythium oligandrum TaxID=41045 RepID=A0A8K1CQG7_PYTOL|nr:hypothetical protein Poli38472_007599 [Pythium oligandrum]|eukprot:TMW67927.1 hypothetical protein Poli38472_007599 [Pythium oligandrum]
MRDDERGSGVKTMVSRPGEAARDGGDGGGRRFELVHVLAMFRHGDRSPITSKVGENVIMTQEEKQFWVSRLPEYDQLRYLNDGTQVVLRHESATGQVLGVKTDPPSPSHGGRWPCGQLTIKGVHEMTANGRRFREQYAEFLRNANPTHDVYVHSTNIRRTIRSAQSVLSGMFPEHFPDAQGMSSTQQPIAIHIDDRNSLGPSHSYELFQSIDGMLGDELKYGAPAGLEKTAEHVRRVAGIQKGRLIPWSGLREILMCRREHQLAFPTGIDQNLFSQIYEHDAWLWHKLYGSRDFCVGSFRHGVQRFLDQLDAVGKNNSRHKLTLFSAHDNSLVALMRALQVELINVLPHYGDMLIFEIHRDVATRDLFLRARFQGQDLTFHGHSHAALCPLSHVQALALEFLRHQPQQTA